MQAEGFLLRSHAERRARRGLHNKSGSSSFNDTIYGTGGLPDTVVGSRSGLPFQTQGHVAYLSRDGQGIGILTSSP